MSEESSTRISGGAISNGLRAFGAPLAFLAIGCGLGEFPFLAMLAILIVPIAGIMFFVQALRSLPGRSAAAENGITPILFLIGTAMLLIGTVVLVVGNAAIPYRVLAPYYRVPPTADFAVNVGAFTFPVPVFWIAAPLMLAFGAKLRSGLSYSAGLRHFAIVAAVFPLTALITFLIVQGYPVDS